MTKADAAARLVGEFKEALIERFEKRGKTCSEAAAIIAANRVLFVHEFNKALDTVKRTLH